MMEKLGHSYSKRKADFAHDIQWRRTVPFNYSHYFIAIGIHTLATSCSVLIPRSWQSICILLLIASLNFMAITLTT